MQAQVGNGRKKNGRGGPDKENHPEVKAQPPQKVQLPHNAESQPPKRVWGKEVQAAPPKQAPPSHAPIQVQQQGRPQQVLSRNPFQEYLNVVALSLEINFD